MPTYDYICLSCGKDQEIFHPMNETSLKQCKECTDGVLEKQISGGSGIIFKGSGFYETDYKQKGTTAGSKPEGACSHKSACGCGN